MTTCARCGTPLVHLPELADTATRTLIALDTRRLAVPDAVRVGLVVLVAGLACYGGACRPSKEPTQ